MGRAIKYVGYYDSPNNESECRSYSPAASAKMDYLIECLNRLGHNAHVVSASYTRNGQAYRGGSYALGEQNTLRLFSTLPWGGPLRRAASSLWSRLALLLWLLASTRRSEVVLVYHSLGYAREIALAQAIRRFRLVLEVEELYSDITGSRRDRREEDLVFRAADAFIFPTRALDSMVNLGRKPYAVVHGTYHVEPDLRRCFDDGRIHVVYAGTFDARKGGAATAIEAARFLDGQFHIHIIGFGSPADSERVLNRIHEVAQESDCLLTFDGSLTGLAYRTFIQSCDVGLSTQSSSQRFSATSFPSKILSYMSNGLRVVSSRVQVVEESGVGDLVRYYDGDEPENVAAAIRSIDFDDSYDSRTRLHELDRVFTEELDGLLT